MPGSPSRSVYQMRLHMSAQLRQGMLRWNQGGPSGHCQRPDFSTWPEQRRLQRGIKQKINCSKPWKSSCTGKCSSSLPVLLRGLTPIPAQQAATRAAGRALQSPRASPFLPRGSPRQIRARPGGLRLPQPPLQPGRRPRLSPPPHLVPELAGDAALHAAGAAAGAARVRALRGAAARGRPRPGAVGGAPATASSILPRQGTQPGTAARPANPTWACGRNRGESKSKRKSTHGSPPRGVLPGVFHGLIFTASSTRTSLSSHTSFSPVFVDMHACQ